MVRFVGVEAGGVRKVGAAVNHIHTWSCSFSLYDFGVVRQSC